MKWILILFCTQVFGAECYSDGTKLVEPVRNCSPKLIGVIHRCDANGCDVMLADGTKGKTTKWPVEFAKVHPEVCQ